MNWTQITWKVGGTTLVGAQHAGGHALTAGAVLIITLWISAGIESRLLRSGHRRRALAAQGGQQCRTCAC